MTYDKQYFMERLAECPEWSIPCEPIEHDYSYPDDKQVSLDFLRERCRVQDISGEGDLSEQGLRLTKWVHRSFQQDRLKELFENLDAAFVWNHYRGKEQGIGCGTLSNFLAQALLAAGYPARLILGLSCIPEDKETHTVVVAFSEQYPEGIAFDPMYGTDFRDADNRPLSLRQLRAKLAAGERIQVQPEVSNEYLGYVAKNVFRFQAYANSFYHKLTPHSLQFNAWWPPAYNYSPNDERIPAWRKQYIHITGSGSAFWDALKP